MSYGENSTKKKSKPQKVKLAIERLGKMETDKSPYIPVWQSISEYFLTRKENFVSTSSPGAFLNDEIFDGTGPSALMKGASVVGGMLWPNGAKSIVIKPIRGIKDTEEVKKYYDAVTERVAEAMDDPRAGLQIAVDEYMIDQFGIGTSGITVERGKYSKLSYKAENVKFMCIDEGPDGFVDTIYIVLEWKLRQVVAQYGLQNLHPETQKRYNDGKEEDKIRVLFCVQPRMDKDPKKAGVLGMDFESMHIEIEKRHLIKEGGFSDLPTKVGRFRKVLGEIYARSLAMEALPDVQEINAIWESVTIGIEKQVEPPLYVLDDGVLGGGTIDTSAGGLSVFNVAGRTGSISDPIKPIFTVESIKDAASLIERLENSIANHFMLDRLLDFNNEAEMTLGEANMRDRLRGFLIGSIFARQTSEVFTPMSTRSVNLMFEDGELGVIEGSKEHQKLIEQGEDAEDILLIPPAVVKRMKDKDGNPTNKLPFKVEYISPAARILQAEQARGIIQTLDFVISASQVNPETPDVMDMDEAAEIISFVSGAPTKVITSKEARDKIRQGRAQAMEEQKIIEGAPKAADAAKKIAEANSYGLNGKGKGNRATKRAA